MTAAHVPILDLNVPKRWRVGRVTIRPAGWLQRYTSGHTPAESAVGWHDIGLRAVEQHRDATAEVRIRFPADRGVYDDAVEWTRDAVALMLVYKRTRYPRLPVGIQDFGVSGDLGRSDITSVVTRGRRIVGPYGRRQGNLGRWEFSRADVDEYFTDRRIAYLDSCVKTLPHARDPMQRRFVLALRTGALAVTVLHDALKLALLASAMEALVGSDPDPGSELRVENLKMVQRASFVTCGRPADRYPARRPCELLRVSSLKKLQNVVEDRAERGMSTYCSWFDHVFGLFGDRNEALHTGATQIDRGRMGRHVTTLDNVLLDLVDWVLDGRGTSIMDLDREMAAATSA